MDARELKLIAAYDQLDRCVDEIVSLLSQIGRADNEHSPTAWKAINHLHRGCAESATLVRVLNRKD